jgi:hypothetical protein
MECNEVEPEKLVKETDECSLREVMESKRQRTE